MALHPRATADGHAPGALAGTALFALLSGAFLWLPGRVTPWLWVAVGTLALGVCLLLPDRRWFARAGLLRWVVVGYLAAVLMSAGMHHLALTRLDPAAYITAGRGTAYWGDVLLLRQTAVYLLFPILLMVGVALFQNVEKPATRLILLPLLLLPSLAVALYQSYVDFGFWNRTAATWSERVPGLGSDVNGFGISLFLLFPITLTAMVAASAKWLKGLYGLILILICWAVFASGSRTAFVGTLLLLPVFFVLRQRVGGPRKRKGSGVRVAAVAATLVIVLLAGGVLLNSGPLRDIPLAKRLQHSLELVRKNGDLRRFSSRWELGLQAVRMTALSPVAGWGPGGFWRQVDNMRTRYGERPGYLDNAEDLYLQVAAELGLPAVGGMLLFFLIPMGRGMGSGARGGEPLQRFTVGMAIATLAVTLVLCLTGPHIFSPEVAWIVCVLLGFVWAAGMDGGARQPPVRIRPAWAAAAVVIFLTLFGAGTYAASLGGKGYLAIQRASWWPLKNEYGLYFPWEDWGPPYGKMVWTSRKSSTRIRMRHNRISLTVFAPGATAQPEKPLLVTISVDGKLLDRLSFSTTGTRKLTYFLPGKRNRSIFFQTEVNRTFVPRAVGLGDDRRVLGIALSPVYQR